MPGSSRARRPREAGGSGRRGHRPGVRSRPAVGRARHPARRAVDAARGAGRAVRAAAGALAWRYGFRHALICDAIYDHIPQARAAPPPRADRRRGCRHGRRTDAFLALHYERAGRRADAHAAALRGAANASAISSHSEARELYARAATAPPTCRRPSAANSSSGSRRAPRPSTTTRPPTWPSATRERDALAGGDALAAAAVVWPRVAVRHLLGEGLEARADALRAASPRSLRRRRSMAHRRRTRRPIG